MLNKLTILLMIGIGLAKGECPETPDPCVHYTELNDPTRSTSYIYDGSKVSDFLMEPGWYRSVSPAGGDMPTQPPGVINCNAFAQVWLNGAIPSVADGVTTMQTCTHFRNNICQTRQEIKVKNCNDEYRVYCLGPIKKSAVARYCFGEESPCPEGTTSANGYTPNCQAGDDLTLTGDPELQYSVEYDPFVIPDILTVCRPYYEFKCNVEHDDNTVFLDVQWYADDDLVSEQVGDNAIAYTDLPAVLSTDTLAANGYLLGTTIKCRLAARDAQSANSNVGAPKEVEFFAGVTVDDSSQFIHLEEGGGPGTYHGTYTLPYRCEFTVDPGQQCSDDLHQCQGGFDIGVVNVDSQTGGCPATGSDVTLEIEQSAGCVVTSNEFDFSVKVHPNPDHVVNPRRDLVLQLQVLPGHSNRFWAGALLPRAVIAINDTDAMLGGKYCIISDDPHQQSFDGSSWTEVQLEGVFLMYRHKTLPISVEVYFREASAGYYTYNCGGAVRSGGQVFVFDACRDNAPTRITLYECDEGLQQMQVTELSPTSYEILLPTGTRVILGRSRQYVYPSIFDWGQTEGLCGNFNGIDTPEDDKVVRGTNIVDHGTPNPRWPQRLDYNQFSLSYRIPEDETLYFGYVRDEANYENLYFCQCTGDNADPGAECSVTPNVDCLAGDHPGANGFSHRCTLARKRRQVNVVTGQEEDPPKELFPYDPNFRVGQNGNTGNWNEQTATAHCNRLFAANTNAQACMAVPNVNIEKSIENCVADILMTGTNALDQVHINVFIELCKEEAGKFDFESDSDEVPITQEEIQEILMNICPDQCSGQGDCIEGVCICDEGFAGVSCAIDIQQAPIILELPNNGTCDLKNQPCEKVAVYGSTFLKESVVCRLQFTDGTGVRRDINWPGQYIHSEKVMCPTVLGLMDQLEITPPRRYPHSMTLSVSNDGRRFSNEKVFHILDTEEEPGCQTFDLSFGSQAQFDIINNDGRILIRPFGFEAPVIDLGHASESRVTVTRELRVTVCLRERGGLE